ncbi:MAG TPA: trimethylamine methyltransferase family protein, partial [archaeon]|nr:trimethylamine methyltransferase family protein [archaeon]
MKGGPEALPPIFIRLIPRGVVTHMIMRRGGYLKFLSNEQIYEIHASTLDLLEHVGVQVESEEALKLLNGVGAAVDFKTKRVRIGPDLVGEAVKKTPPSFILHARNA